MGQGLTVLRSDGSQHSVVTASTQGQSTGGMTDASKGGRMGNEKTEPGKL